MLINTINGINSMDMFRQETMTELDLLNKHIRDFIALYEWFMNKDEISLVLEDYLRPRQLMQETLPVITKEIYICGDLPSDSDRDRQDFEQLVIFLRSLVAEKRERVAVEHLDEALEKIRAQLMAVNTKDYSSSTKEAIVALEIELNAYPDTAA